LQRNDPPIPQGTSTDGRSCSLNYDHFVCTTQWYDYRLYVFLDVYAEPAAASILCVPFLQGGEGTSEGEEGRGGKGAELVGVLELARKAGRPQFGPEDEEIVHNYFSWAAVASTPPTCHTTCQQQRLLNESLMVLTR